MRVAIVIDSLRTAGAQKFVTDFAVAASRRIEPWLISLDDDSSPGLRMAVEAAGVRIVELPASHLFDLRRFWRFVNVLSPRDFDVIHAHLAYATILGSIAGRLMRTPVIATVHTTGSEHDQVSAQVRSMERLCLRYLSARIVAVGVQVAAALDKAFDARKVRVIQNGIPKPAPVSPQDRDARRRELAGQSRGVIIVAVARFVSVKGHADLVEAFALLHSMIPDAVLVLVGAGRLLDDIREQVTSLGLYNSVRMLGAREDVAALLAASDVFVSASHREGLPISVLEAMMAGLPIVATGVGEMPRLVTEETGRLVPPHRPDLLADALREVVQAPEMRQAMGQAARERAVREYSVDLCVDRHIALYHEVLGTHGQGTRTWQPSA